MAGFAHDREQPLGTEEPRQHIVLDLVRHLTLVAAVAVGDDCAAIPDGDGFLLFAIEGFMNEFVARDPWFAGWCGVMVNVSDIAAMGGGPKESAGEVVTLRRPPGRGS